MSIEYLQWKSESHMEAWLAELIMLHPKTTGLFPRLPDGFMWEYEEGERDGGEVCLDVFSQVQIPNSNCAGNGPAPCDLLFKQQVLTESGRLVTTVAIVIELKNRPLKAGDFGQLVRYVDGLKKADGLIDPGCPAEIVLGALVGDGYDRQVEQVASRMSGFKSFDTTLFGNEIIIDAMGISGWFPHGDTLAVSACEVPE